MRNLMRRFAADRSGAVAILVAGGIIAFVGFIGLATDAARGYMVKEKLSEALDAAALAGGRVMNSPNRDADIISSSTPTFHPTTSAPPMATPRSRPLPMDGRSRSPPLRTCRPR